MKKELTTEKVLGAYNIVNTAKYNKLDDSDKIKVWKIARALKPVATKFEDESKDAADKMKPENFDERLVKAQEYERKIKDENLDASTLPMSAAEYSAFIDELRKYNELVSKTVKEYADKTVKIDFEPISEDAFGKLMASNDWTMDKVVELGMLIVD